MSRKYCEEHQNRKLEFACLDQFCSQSDLQCVICVKKNHKECKSNLLIKLNCDFTASHKLKFKYDESILLDIQEQLKKVFEQFLQEINQLQNIEVTQIKENLKVDVQEIKKNPNKNKFNFHYDKKTNKIFIVPKEINLIRDLKEFEKVYQKNTDNFKKRIFDVFQMIRFHSDSMLNVNLIKIHDCLKIKKQSNGFDLSLPESQNRYYLAIYNKPIKKNINIEIEVDNLNPSDRYCEIGFLNSSQYNSHKSTMRGQYLLGKHCFCGYQKKGMDGLFQALNLSNPKGLENKKIIKFEFNYLKDELRIIYNGQNKTNIFAKIDSKSKDFYFYICLYYKDQIARVRFKQQFYLIFFNNFIFR